MSPPFPPLIQEYPEKERLTELTLMNRLEQKM
jgi:hypothetical protein